MKNNKKDFKKFTSREKTKQRAKRELLRMVEELNVGTSAVHVAFSEETGHGKHRSADTMAVGTFAESAAGYGFVSIGDGKRDIFIPENYVRDALDSDTVKISYRTYRDMNGEERTEGRILEVLECGRKKIIGTVDSETVRIHKRRIERLFVIPDDGRIKRRIYLTDSCNAERGDKVIARIIRGASYTYSLEAEVPSARIGEYAMEKLRKIDQVAYVRFASVYREFQDIQTFSEEINRLLGSMQHGKER
jgi:exoribonuclease R